MIGSSIVYKFGHFITHGIWPSLKFLYNPFGLVHWLPFVLWLVYFVTVGIIGTVVGVRFKWRDFNLLSDEHRRRFHIFRRLDEDSFSLFYHIIGSFSLLPIKIIAAGVMFSLFLLSVKVVDLSLRFEKTRKSRRFSDRVKIRLTRLLFAGLHLMTAISCRLLLFLFGVIKIRETLPKGMPDLDRNTLGTVVSNHVSICDILYLITRIFPSFIAKKSVSQSMLGPTARMLRCIYIDRGDPNDRLSAINQIRERQIQFQEEWKNGSSNPAPPLVVFPEGSTSSGRSLIGFKRGAFITQTPVTPLIFIYRCRGFNLSLDTLKLHDWLVLALANPFLSIMDVYWMREQGPQEVVCPITEQNLQPDEILPKFVSEIYETMEKCLLKNQHWPQEVSESWRESVPTLRLKHKCRMELERIIVQRNNEPADRKTK